MVRKGEFIDFAASKEVNADFLTNETVYNTEMQVIIELSKKIIELEARIITLEKIEK